MAINFRSHPEEAEEVAREIRAAGAKALLVQADVAGVPGWLNRRPSHSAERVARGALRALEKRKQCYIPGWRNYLLTMLVRMAPRKVVVRESMRYFRPGRSSTPSDPEVVQTASSDSAR